MIFIGLDDTDADGEPGTNRLARRVAQRLAQRWGVYGITRHQLLVHPSIPYTSKNSSAAIMLREAEAVRLEEIARVVCELVLEGSAPGSDPGVCVAERVPQEVTRFGRRAQRQVLSRQAAHCLAARCKLYLEGLAGTKEGVTGALAAVGLAASGHDGRFVQLGQWPDDLSGRQARQVLIERGVELFIREPDGTAVEPQSVDVGKRLRPAYRGGRVVLHVLPAPSGWVARRKT